MGQGLRSPTGLEACGEDGWGRRRLWAAVALYSQRLERQGGGRRLLLEPEGPGELGRVWGRTLEARERTRRSPYTVMASPLGPTVLRGCGYTHFTDGHGGAEDFQDLTATKRLLRFKCRPLLRSPPSSPPVLGPVLPPGGHSGQPGRQGGARQGQDGREDKSRWWETSEQF